MAEQVTKKEWTEPELIVLVRSNPEEAVLVGCKGFGTVVAPLLAYHECREESPPSCPACDVLLNS